MNSPYNKKVYFLLIGKNWLCQVFPEGKPQPLSIICLPVITYFVITKSCFRIDNDTFDLTAAAITSHCGYCVSHVWHCPLFWLTDSGWQVWLQCKSKSWQNQQRAKRMWSWLPNTLLLLAKLLTTVSSCKLCGHSKCTCLHVAFVVQFLSSATSFCYVRDHFFSNQWLKPTVHETAWN